VAIPVVEFEAHSGNRLDEVDADNAGVEPRGWGIVNHIVKELLDRTSEEVAIGIAEDGRFLVEGRLHIGTSASLRTIDIMLDRLGNRLMLSQVGRCVAHGCLSSCREVFKVPLTLDERLKCSRLILIEALSSTILRTFSERKG
jgi:hypothetical protein